MIPYFQVFYSGPNGFDNAATFVAQNGREQSLRIRTREGVRIGVTDTGGNDAHQNLSLLGRCNVNFDNF